MTAKQLNNAFQRWSEQQVPLVLATVFETEGSTYSKAGAQMLITGEGDFQGMLSGGCLEGDLAERARAVLDNGVPQSVTYDLGSNDEELWGLGVGCDGLMRIFLQPLTPQSAYQPFAAMSIVFDGDREHVAATILQTESIDLKAGAALVGIDGMTVFSSINEFDRPQIEAEVNSVLHRRESTTKTLSLSSGPADVLFSLLRPSPKILVLGAGLDAEPVVRLAGEIGWRVTVQDHRPAYIDSGHFEMAEQVHCIPVGEVQNRLSLDDFAAAIVMSHHLSSDRQYLQQLADSEMAYIGLLGPKDRRQRLLRELGSVADRLEFRVHGPAGIDIGARGPASIALSIVAHMQQQLAEIGIA